MIVYGYGEFGYLLNINRGCGS